jgi:aspartate/methionine/tyrosine aminotransferase
MATRTGERTARLAARVEPELVEAVEQLREGNGIESQSDMVRLLIRRGVKAVVDGDNPAAVKQPLNREQYAERAQALMEALSDLLARVESHDPEGAILLAGAARDAFTRYEKALKRSAKR